MSGRKDTEIRLQRERQEKLDLLAQIQSSNREVNALRAHLTGALDAASPGLIETFANEAGAARSWLADLDVPEISTLSASSGVTVLRQSDSKYTAALNAGRHCREALTVAFTKSADVLGSSLAAKIADVEGSLLASRDLLGLWFGDDQVRSWDDRLEHHRVDLAAERYRDLEGSLNQLGLEISTGAAETQALEAKHQKRVYLLTALRQVCKEMGFVEVDAPRYESHGQRKSAICLLVDTLDRGQIRFSLSLDRLSTFSEIADQHCFEEFGQLSQFLEDEFGIETDFTMEDGTPLSSKKHQGEKDLPSGVDRVRHA